jgi:Tfp pilus assembly protein PilF
MQKGREVKTTYLYLSLILISFLPYIPLLNADFVHWDDDVYIVENSRVQKGVTIENIKWAFTTTYFGFYYPLTWLSHMLDCSLFGLNASMHHLTNLLWHIANTLLLFSFFHSATKEKIKSFVLSFLFAVHPLNVESVAWISERKNLLAAFFFLLGLNLYLFYLKNPNIRNYTLLYLSFLLGMMAKPILVTFPFALLLIDLWPLKRIKLEKNILKENKESLYEKIWFLIPIPIFVYLTIIAQKDADALASLSYITFKDRVAGAVIALKDYIVNFIFPIKLTALYPHLKGDYSISVLVLSFVLILFIFALSLKYFKKNPLYLFGFLWFVINLAPVLGIIQVGDQARADRYMYIPMVGLLSVIVFGLNDIVDISNKKIVFGFFVTVFILFSVKTHYQCLTWKNTETLFSNMIKVSPKASQAYHNIAIVCKERGDIDGAIENYKKALEIDPCKAKSLNNLGSCYAETGDYYKAIECFKKSIECNPNLSQGYYNLGLSYEHLGDINKAIEYYQKTVELDPKKEKAYNNIGICFTKMNDFKTALYYFEKAYQLNKENPSIIFNYALANEETGNVTLAKNLYQEVLRIDNKHNSSRKRLIGILIKESNYDKAIKLTEEGISINSGDEELNQLKKEIQKKQM